LGIEGFLLPSGFIDGGVTGVSMLVAALGGGNLPLLILVINLPFIVFGFSQLNFSFGVKSSLSILGLALAIAFIPYPMVSRDPLLAAVFGGFFLGSGIGLSIRGGGVLDGTEILALLVSKKIGSTVGDIVLFLNVIIFCSAAFFLGIEPALYSILTYFSASKMIDFLIHGLEEFYGVVIISQKSEQIKDQVISTMGRGVTVYNGRGGRSGVDQEILFCVLTRLEIPKIRNLIEEVDEAAFFFTHHISEVSGGVLARLPVKI